ncbi:winged helix-turn-helix domain-containing protein [Desulfuribacillus alkaliarsenatis]|uniref:HTH lysR-type domain-containing protein n=1 Tax=Desulfuribacillus alkaliarsenatis TaxID=766136 RepID=A0A1E5G273_9FIRM|nr:LysR family transcriptional regulator [Desulfuribacillus alkaliarsenatis]OEF97007.1 hypothetical protein BHF68_05240 [Desulfuribacillus alkaliarsenatis]
MAEKQSNSHAKSKVWLVKGENVVYGDGRQALLSAIKDTGSIRQAASRLGMSYRAAWGKIKATEERLGLELVSTKAGGNDSGTNLTEAGIEFMKKYEQFKAESNDAVDEIHRKYFG